MIILVGLSRPYRLRSNNRLEIFNEFILLLVNYHLTSLTDWVSDGDTRYMIGWAMITVTVLGMTVNLSLLAREIMGDFLLKYKKWKHKRVYEAEQEKWRRRLESERQK